jgi:hypothetical protein
MDEIKIKKEEIKLPNIMKMKFSTTNYSNNKNLRNSFNKSLKLELNNNKDSKYLNYF